MGSTSASVDKLTFKANKDDRRKINRLFCEVDIKSIE